MKNRLLECLLVVLAMVVFAANFEGLAATIGASDLQDYLFVALIATGTGFFMFVFWHTAFTLVPHLDTPLLLVGAWAVTLAGAVTILFFSAWWTIAAISGGEAQNAHYASLTTQAEQSLAAAVASAEGFTSLIPRIEALAADVTAQADCEAASGCVTGSAGTGGVEAFLRQISTSAASVAASATSGAATLTSAEEAGKQCLSDVRAALTAKVEDQANQLSSGLDCLNAVLGDIASVNAGQQAVAALGSLTSGLIIPVGITKPNQIEAANRIVSGLKAKADALAKDAGAYAVVASAAPVTLTRLTATQAVQQYWTSIIPAVATAIALDISPILLLAFRTIGATADRARPDQEVLNWRLGDFLKALRLGDDLHREGRSRRDTVDGKILDQPARRIHERRK